ncbi:methyltransferase [Nitrospira sp.]|nr:methyltransferase [Nitrospira sp.]
MGVTDYNHIARQYQKAKKHLWRTRIEVYSFMRLLGDVQDKAVLDVACGEGYLTRRIRHAGAAEVVGIDISERMIDLAKAQEAADPLGITYRVEDAREAAPERQFDVAISGWLLDYAGTRAELAAMCRGLARSLKPGGRFVTVMTNPALYHIHIPDYRKYGFTIARDAHARDGAPIRITTYLDNGTFDIENYYLPIESYATAFEEAGFVHFSVHPLELAPDPEGADDRQFWADFLASPPFILIDCDKR